MTAEEKQSTVGSVSDQGIFKAICLQCGKLPDKNISEFPRHPGGIVLAVWTCHGGNGICLFVREFRFHLILLQLASLSKSAFYLN